MTARKISLFLITALLVAISATVTRAQSSESSADTDLLAPQRVYQGGQGGILDVLEQIRLAQSQQLEGSWDVIVTPVVPPGALSFHAYGTFARGGAFFGSDRNRPFSKQHGAWAHLGGNNFAYTLKEDLFDAMGKVASILTVRVRLTITGKDTFVGVSNAETRDAAGNIFNRCATVRGERIKIEPLAEQCQGITPPQ